MDINLVTKDKTTTMKTRQKKVIPKPKIQSPRITRAVELKKDKQLKLGEMGLAKKRGRKKKSQANVPSPQMKRKKKVEVASPKRRKKSEMEENVQEKHVDTYCWLCHKICQDHQDRQCGCKRAYHNKCLEELSFVFRYNKCPECQVKKNNSESATRPFAKSLKVYLETAIELIRYKHKKKKLSWSQSKDLASDFTIETLLQKVQNNEYKTTAEFFSDVKWLYHNSFVLHGENSKQTKDMNIVIFDFKEELYDIEACPECYYHLNCIKEDELNHKSIFVRLCNPPHDIVWARVHGHPYWPAKLLKITNGKARVRFFGKHEKADVPAHTVFHISESHPTHKQRDISAGEMQTSLDYICAKKELCDYITIYEENIGNFQFSKCRSFYVPINGSKTFVGSQSSNEERHQKNVPDSSISTNSSSFSHILPSTSMSIPSEHQETANPSSNRAISSYETSFADTLSLGNNPPDNRNCPSASFTQPSRAFLQSCQNSADDRNCPSANLTLRRSSAFLPYCQSSSDDRSCPSSNFALPSRAFLSNCPNSSDYRNCLSANVPLHPRAVFPSCRNSSDDRNCPSVNFIQSSTAVNHNQNAENTLNPNIPSENSSFHILSSDTSPCPTSSYTSPCSASTASSKGFKVKEENCDSDEPYRISSVFSSCPTSGELLQILFEGLPDENPEQFHVKEEVQDAAPSTSEEESQGNANNNENIPSSMENPINCTSSQERGFEYIQGRISQIENNINAIRTEDTLCPTPTNITSGTEGESYVISTGRIPNSRISLNRHQADAKSDNSNIPSIGIQQPENNKHVNLTDKILHPSSEEINHVETVGDKKVQLPRQDGIIALPSSSNIEEIDLTGEDDEDNSCLKISSVVVKNPEIRQMLVETQKQVGRFFTRVIQEVCSQQKPEPLQLCDTLTKKLNEAQKKFEEEAEKFREEIKYLRRKLNEKD